MGLLAVVNLVALILLFKCGLRIMNDFDSQRRQGIKQPIFDANQHPDLDLDPKAWELEPEEAEALKQRLESAPAK
jgi:AGCS family alanine or glycine:cation symporter